MQFNSHATGQDICTFADELAGSDSTSYPIAGKVRAANEGMRIIWGWILDAYGGWRYDDSNNTNLPEGTTALVANQKQYGLPSDCPEIIGVEYKNTSGIWNKLYPMTLEQIQETTAEGNFYTTASNPLYYLLVSNGIELVPAANYSQADSLKVYLSRDVSTFTTTDTTKSPGFDQEFHEALPTYMALRYAKINGSTRQGTVTKAGTQSGLSGDWSLWEGRIKGHYSRRFRQMYPPRMLVRDALREAQ